MHYLIWKTQKSRKKDLKVRSKSGSPVPAVEKGVVNTKSALLGFWKDYSEAREWLLKLSPAQYIQNRKKNEKKKQRRETFAKLLFKSL